MSLGFLGSLGTELGPRVRSFQHGIKKEDCAPTCMDCILHIGHWPGLSKAMCKSGCLLAKVVLYEGSYEQLIHLRRAPLKEVPAIALPTDMDNLTKWN